MDEPSLARDARDIWRTRWAAARHADPRASAGADWHHRRESGHGHASQTGSSPSREASIRTAGPLYSVQPWLAALEHHLVDLLGQFLDQARIVAEVQDLDGRRAIVLDLLEGLLDGGPVHVALAERDLEALRELVQ